MAFCSILLLSYLASSVSADWLDGNDGVDRFGSDLPGMPISMKNGSVPQNCSALCNANPECKAWAFVKPNCGGSTSPLCYCKVTVPPQVQNPCRVSGVSGPPFLLPSKYQAFPVGTIKPQGWLLDQLQQQADSLSGHLPYFWADVMNSTWIGGNADSGLHERAPYWLNGFISLAYQLENKTLIATARKYIDYILSHQGADGWLGPDDAQQDGNQYWSKYLVMLSLRQYYEANSSDSRVLPAMMKFLKVAYDRMFKVNLGISWSAARWQDLALTVHWMLENHPAGQEQMLWDLAEQLKLQGLDWKGWYGNSTFPTKAVGPTTLYTHGVNNGMAYKSEAVWYRQSHDQSDAESSYVRMDKLDRYHGQASGIFSCDEHLAGKMPSRGTELCTVVETMFSFEVLFSILGDPVFAERAEKLAYNSLPATITSDMWAHQYLQQGNEMNAVHSDDHIWTHDGPDSTLFGLAPNYGCCTANFNQGWPKFTQHLMMEYSNQVGVAIVMYAPAHLTYTLPDGAEGSVTVSTNYPFDGNVLVSSFCGQGMFLSFRIPSWTFDPILTINGTNAPLQTPPPVPGTMYEVLCTWNTTFNLTFPMKTVVTRRYNNAASIFRGPLLYGLHIKEDFKVLRSYAFESKDYQVTGESPWNYALYLPSDEKAEEDLEVVTRGLQKGYLPFSYEGTPVMINAKGKLLDSWSLAHNAADAPPTSPVKSTNPLTPIVLIPFGATNLRIAEIPTLEDD